MLRRVFNDCDDIAVRPRETSKTARSELCSLDSWSSQLHSTAQARTAAQNANGAVCTRLHTDRLAASPETQGVSRTLLHTQQHFSTTAQRKRTSGRSTPPAVAAMHQRMNRRIQYLLLAHAALIKAFQPPARRLHRLVLRAAADADVNSLMTQLNAAVQQEDFRKAAELKKQLDALRGDDGATTTKTKGGDWASRGAPGWLQARLQDLGMRFPTPVQEAALDAVDGSTDVVVSAPTGSGKTLAFLAPLLKVLDNKLAERERTQLDAGSNLGLLTPQAAMATFSPALWTSAQNLEGFRPPRFGDPRGAPLALVLCPSRALALQLGTACFTIVGGTNRNQGSYFPCASAS